MCSNSNNDVLRLTLRSVECIRIRVRTMIALRHRGNSMRQRYRRVHRAISHVRSYMTFRLPFLQFLLQRLHGFASWRSLDPT